jgi:putative hydrolase of the HAD superfamily
MIRAVVFDLWNTLIQSQKGSPFRRIHGLLHPHQQAMADEFMWDSMRRVFQNSLGFLETWRTPMRLDDNQVTLIQAAFREAGQDAELFPESTAALEATRRLARTALLSNTQSFDMDLLEHLGISEHLKTRILSAEIGFLKPQAAAFQAVQTRMGLFPGNLVMVGDSWIDDVQGALDAGWTAIWINRGGSPVPAVDPETTLVVLPDLQRVPEVIAQLQAGARCSTCLG